MGNKRKLAAGALALGGIVAVSDAAFNTSYQATVERVIDGDTVVVSVSLAPGLVQSIHMRERDLDTPEKRRGGRGGAQCDAELEAGRKVTALVEQLLPPGTEIGLENVGIGKYAGRWVGDIMFQLPGGGNPVDLGDWLIGQGLAVPYDGGTKAKVWCPVEPAEAG